jgi:hypothetical protein
MWSLRGILSPFDPRSRLLEAGFLKIEIVCPVHATLEKIDLSGSYGTGGARRFQGEVPCGQGSAILEVDVNLGSGHVSSVRFVRLVSEAAAGGTSAD